MVSCSALEHCGYACEPCLGGWSLTLNSVLIQKTGCELIRPERAAINRATKQVTFYCPALNGTVEFKAGFPPSLIQGGRKLTLNSIWAQILAFPSIVGSGSCFASTNAGIMKVSAVLTWCGLSWLQAQDTARELSHSVLYFA